MPMPMQPTAHREREREHREREERTGPERKIELGTKKLDPKDLGRMICSEKKPTACFSRDMVMLIYLITDY